MPDILTTPWGFTMPEVGGSDETWGNKLNNNWFTLDDLLATWFTHTGTPPASAPSVLKPEMAPDYIMKNSIIQKDGTKSFRFQDASGVNEGYLQFNDSTKGMSLTLLNTTNPEFSVASIQFLQDGTVTIGSGSATFVNPTVTQKPDKIDQDNSSVLVLGIARSWQFQQWGVGASAELELRDNVGNKRFRIMDDGRVNGLVFNPSTRRLSAEGGNLNLGAAGQDVDATVADALVSQQSIIETDATKWLYFTKANGTERAAVFSSSSDGALRLRVKDDAGVIKSQLNLNFDGTAALAVGAWDYLYIGNKTAAANDVFSGHLMLHNNGYGIGITSGRMNIITPATSYVDFVNVGGEITARVDSANDVSLPNDFTIVTRGKGDERYRNADNLNAGTIPNARMPTGSTEQDRIANLIAQFAVGSLGTPAILCRASVNQGLVWGTIYTGSTLRRTGFYAQNGSENIIMSGNAVSGSWMCCGEIPASSTFNSGAQFVRVI